MAALGDIPGRARFIEYAGGADTEQAALLFQQMAELIATYNTAVAAVRQIDVVFNLPIISTAKTPQIVLLPIDRLLWTPRSAAIAKALAGAHPAVSEIWMTGDATPRAQAGLSELGLVLTPQCGKRLPLLD